MARISRERMGKNMGDKTDYFCGKFRLLSLGNGERKWWN